MCEECILYNGKCDTENVKSEEEDDESDDEEKEVIKKICELEVTNLKD